VLRVVKLPSLADELDRLPLRWSERVSLAAVCRPQDQHFAESRSLALPNRKAYGDDDRRYMRDYMRARRAQQRQASQP
jgi:hypothetical protein